MTTEQQSNLDDIEDEGYRNITVTFIGEEEAEAFFDYYAPKRYDGSTELLGCGIVLKDDFVQTLSNVWDELVRVDYSYYVLSIHLERVDRLKGGKQ